jgi:type I restriction enzyme S subunit
MITMKNNNIEKNYNIPGLRFPEFKNDGEWNLEPFGDVYSFKVTNSFSRENLNYVEGSVKNIHYGDIHTKFSALFDITNEIVPYINPSMSIDKIRLECYCIEGDMIFADASEDLNDIGKSIEICNLNDEKLVSGLHTLLARQKKPKFIVGFGGHLFLSNGIRTQIQKEAQGSKVLSISTGRLSNIRIYYPENKREQQKIASCLSSLDELIAAENQKLDALKTHKKGLMQQLFPAEGETVPQLRFEEFLDSGEWRIKPFSKVAENLDSKRVPITESVRVKGMVPYYGASGVIDYVRDFIFDDDLLCISEDGANLVARTYPIAFSITGKTWVNNHAHVLKFEHKYTQILVENYLNAINLEEFLTGMAQPKLNRAKLDIIPIPLPKPNEQQKIASCLSSLDELIAAQSQKTEALKVHKKGLMQGLFPNVNEL